MFAREAVDSAIHDVRNAIAGAALVAVAPDLVGVTDMADLFAFSPQKLRKLLQK